MPREVLTMGVDASREPATTTRPDGVRRTDSSGGNPGRERCPNGRNRCEPPKSGWRRSVKRTGQWTTSMPRGAVKPKVPAVTSERSPEPHPRAGR